MTDQEHEAWSNDVLPIPIRPKALDGIELEIPPGDGPVLIRIETCPEETPAEAVFLLAGLPVAVRAIRRPSAAPPLRLAT